MRTMFIAISLVALSACGTTSAKMTPAEEACMVQATKDVPQRLDYAGIDLNHDMRMKAYHRCVSGS